MPNGTHGFYSKGLMELVEEQALDWLAARAPRSPPPQRGSNEGDHFRFGTFETSRDVRSSVALGVEADMAPTPRSGRE
jgi:hypothetical protein